MDGFFHIRLEKLMWVGKMINFILPLLMSVSGQSFSVKKGL